MNQSLPTISYYEYIYQISSEHDPTKLMYGWTKWGGGRKGMVQEKNPVWFCQSCRKEFPEEVTSFMFPIYNREFGRICQSCLDSAILYKIQSLWDLMKVFKKDHGIFD